MTAPRKKTGGSRASYDPRKAGSFWSRRLKSTHPLAAVLTYNAPDALNKAYDRWETQSLMGLLPQSTANRQALDIGCGIGRLTVVLAEAGMTVTAIDLSPDMLAHCRARARRRRVASRVTTICGSAHTLEGVQGKFDIITCFGLLEHLPPRQRRSCLTNAFLHLKKRGRMFVVVNNKDNVLLKSAYPLKQQRADGYFASLVGVDWLAKVCKSNDMRLTLKAANPFYALTHYHLLPHRKRLGVTDLQLAKLSRQACDLDLQYPLDGPVPQRLASHFLVEIRHS